MRPREEWLAPTRPTQFAVKFVVWVNPMIVSTDWPKRTESSPRISKNKNIVWQKIREIFIEQWWRHGFVLMRDVINKRYTGQMTNTTIIRMGTNPNEKEMMMASKITFSTVMGMNSSRRISLATSSLNRIWRIFLRVMGILRITYWNDTVSVGFEKSYT